MKETQDIKTRTKLQSFYKSDKTSFRDVNRRINSIVNETPLVKVRMKEDLPIISSEWCLRNWCESINVARFVGFEAVKSRLAAPAGASIYTLLLVENCPTWFTYCTNIVVCKNNFFSTTLCTLLFD